MYAPRDSDSTSRLLAAVVAGSAVRDALRREPPSAAGAHRTATPASPVETERCRQRLLGGDVDAAYEFLERIEPDTLAQAHSVAFEGHAGPPAGRSALRTAWESYRHDRYRGAN